MCTVRSPLPLTLSAPRHSKSPEESRVFGIPHPSFLCRVKRALPFLLPQHRRTTREMDRENGSTEREREENQISDLRPVAFSFVAN